MDWRRVAARAAILSRTSSGTFLIVIFLGMTKQFYWLRQIKCVTARSKTVSLPPPPT